MSSSRLSTYVSTDRDDTTPATTTTASTRDQDQRADSGGRSATPRSEPEGPGPRTGLLRVLVAIVVAVLASGIAFELRTAIVPTDPWHYLLAGQTFPEQSWLIVGLTRYGMVLPMMAITRLFGFSELSFYLLPCVATGLLVGGTYWLAARFYGWLAGVVASVLVLANGVIMFNATRLYPDIPAMAMTVLAVITAVMSRDAWAQAPRMRVFVVATLLMTGLFIGLSWEMRETALFGWPVVLGVLLWRGGPPVRWSVPLTALPALGVLAVELAINRWAFGDAMARFVALTGPDMSQTTNPGDVAYLGHSRSQYLFTVWNGVPQYLDGQWMRALAVVAVLSGVVFWRRVGLFTGWFLLVLALFTLAGGALDPAHPHVRVDVARYWVAFLVPMIIAAVGGVTLACRWFSARFLRGRSPVLRSALGVLVAVLLVAGPLEASAQNVRQNPTFLLNDGNSGALFRTWLHEHDSQVTRMFTDWESARVLGVYDNSFSGTPMSRVKWLSITGPRRPRPGGYVVLYSVNSPVCPFCQAKMHTSWLDAHRAKVARWDRVWQDPRGTFIVYRVPKKTAH